MYEFTYRIDIGGDFTGHTDFDLRFHGGLTRDNDETGYIISVAHELEAALKKLHMPSKVQAERKDETEVFGYAEKSPVRLALAYAEHEFAFMHGLYAADNEEFKEAFQLDTTEGTRLIRAAFDELDKSASTNNEDCS